MIFPWAGHGTVRAAGAARSIRPSVSLSRKVRRQQNHLVRLIGAKCRRHPVLSLGSCQPCQPIVTSLFTVQTSVQAFLRLHGCGERGAAGTSENESEDRLTPVAARVRNPAPTQCGTDVDRRAECRRATIHMAHFAPSGVPSPPASSEHRPGSAGKKGDTCTHDAVVYSRDIRRLVESARYTGPRARGRNLANAERVSDDRCCNKRHRRNSHVCNEDHPRCECAKLAWPE